ncbi:hypothetical protein [Hymenobacter jeollabukensis]|uniref:Uncharacterized protein n=1 Tax=Hymenobacter jeollabukensis TaxID=2025313 RepID=A0A5R8WTK7_9BACT|nr:hypothetical protein [Hymenobacter jeollabukensis]TLM95100.1 hypothetical protein FDY95_04690 [Hymenobacter jeollabukensis]
MNFDYGIALKVIGLLDEEDNLLHYEAQFSNGNTATTIEFYAYEDEFKPFSEQLVDFPKTVESRATFQTSDDEEKYTEYLKLEVFCYEPNGTSAIRVHARKNSTTAPYYHHSEFFLQGLLPAALSLLGSSLSSWNPLKEPEFVWPSRD